MPSLHDSLEPLSTNVAKRNETTSMKIALDNSVIKFPLIGEIKATIPSIKVIFTTALPITVPRAISGWPFNTALLSNISSGKVVPIDMKNRPIKITGRASSIDKALPDITVSSALIKSNIRLPKKIKRDNKTLTLNPFLRFVLNSFCCLKSLKI